MKVLIADDHEMFRTECANFISEHLGAEVVAQAQDGNEAVKETLRLHPDLVLIDISMPEMSGFEAARQIKSFSPATKVVFVTAEERRTYEAMGVLLHVDGFIYKNSIQQELPEMLNRLQKINSKTAAL